MGGEKRSPTQAGTGVGVAVELVRTSPPRLVKRTRANGRGVLDSKCVGSRLSRSYANHKKIDEGPAGR
jgi:hypothetical protein